MHTKFTSKFRSYQVHVRDPIYFRYPDGTKEIERNSLVADFSDPTAGEVEDPDASSGLTNIEGGSDFARSTRTFISRGGFFDVDAEAERLQWTKEERDLVVLKLNRMLERGEKDFQAYEPPKNLAPWPTYDALHPKQIAGLAFQMGLVEAALIYEQRSKNRPEVVRMLNDQLEQQQATQALTAA